MFDLTDLAAEERIQHHEMIMLRTFADAMINDVAEFNCNPIEVVDAWHKRYGTTQHQGSPTSELGMLRYAAGHARSVWFHTDDPFADASLQLAWEVCWDWARKYNNTDDEPF